MWCTGDHSYASVETKCFIFHSYGRRIREYVEVKQSSIYDNALGRCTLRSYSARNRNEEVPHHPTRLELQILSTRQFRPQRLKKLGLECSVVTVLHLSVVFLLSGSSRFCNERCLVPGTTILQQHLPQCVYGRRQERSNIFSLVNLIIASSLYATSDSG